jgi:hypothetical protein
VVEMADPLLHGARVGDKMVHAARCLHIPHAQIGQEQGQNRPEQPADPLAPHIVGGAPGEAHGRVAVADVDGARPGDHALGVGAG